ncbi:hypothetical protein B0J13DRAFT_566327 [Dactylonectria estremocensis]|uniref:CFEM domain-containing protein n=1 Tax=Dactylonectria estremocensis TaxID=1079267 RepID=A0A9P9DPZ7_9HYPO|nr:hypothetical protein B0J13DRAFT_566327 [Dactylonectria estremocensis]
MVVSFAHHSQSRLQRLLKECILLVALSSAHAANCEASSVSTSFTSSPFKSLSQCALDCFTLAISNSSCSTTNLACAYSDAPLKLDAYTCIYLSCTPKEIISTKIQTSIQRGQEVRDCSSKNTITAILFAIPSGLLVLYRIVFKVHDKLSLALDDMFILSIGRTYEHPSQSS